MADALQEVKRVLGSGAVILHTRQYKRGGILGIGAKQVVEVTAADGQELGRHRNKQGRASKRSSAQRSRATGEPSRRQSEAPSPDAASQQTAGDLIRRTYAAARAEFANPPREAAEPSPAAASGAPTAATAAAPQATATPTVQQAPPGPSQDQLAQEMAAVKRMVGQVMRQQSQSGGDTAYRPGSSQLEQQYLALLEQEVAQELAAEIVDDVHRRLDTNQHDDPEACRQAMVNALGDWLPTANSDETLKPTNDGRPRTIALVGPTGVGKTTTIAKLAATFKIKQNKSVGLVTLDTYRIAAVDQLRTYAGIIGLDLHVASTPDELERALQRLSDCDVVLIDTAGRSQRNNQRLDELSECLTAANPHEVHLVLSSTCSQQVLEQTVEKFSCLRTDRIIFTKLDEAVNFGVVLNVARKVNKQLSYITTGQDVPHQIEPGQSKRLAELVLGEGEIGP
jgi:flagellar biosynthesis protein FlhF